MRAGSRDYRRCFGHGVRSLTRLMANTILRRTWAPVALHSQGKSCFLCLSKKSTWIYPGIMRGRCLPSALGNTPNNTPGLHHFHRNPATPRIGQGCGPLPDRR